MAQFDSGRNRFSVGLGNASSYMVSSKPYMSSSVIVASGGDTVVRLDFPNVSKFITVRNMGPTGSDTTAADNPGGTAGNAPLRFGFSHIGVSGTVQQNYVVLNNGESYTGDFRVSRLYLKADKDGGSLNCTASVIAGMTGIDAVDLGRKPYDNWSGSAGVG